MTLTLLFLLFFSPLKLVLILNSCESFLSWQGNESGYGYVNELASVCFCDHMEGQGTADIIRFNMRLRSYFGSKARGTICRMLARSLFPLLKTFQRWLTLKLTKTFADVLFFTFYFSRFYDPSSTNKKQKVRKHREMSIAIGYSFLFLNYSF